VKRKLGECDLYIQLSGSQWGIIFAPLLLHCNRAVLDPQIMLREQNSYRLSCPRGNFEMGTRTGTADNHTII